MAGLYLHIPFCKSKCAYCNFFSVVSEKQRADFLDALEHEAILRKDYLGGEEVRTIYFGGGTPTVLEALEVLKVLEVLRENYNISAAAEIYGLYFFIAQIILPQHCFPFQSGKKTGTLLLGNDRKEVAVSTF